MDAPRVVSVAPGSPADDAGIVPGDELLTINGEAPRDVLRYRQLVDDGDLDLEVRGPGGLERSVRVAKRVGEPLGCEVHSAVFDRVVTCDNHCPFCFIHQLPPGMRKSLSLKDDDYRLSFLYGNFTTLTRFTELDLERVIDEALDPLYVSIHATDPWLRARLLRNRRGAISLRWLRALLDAGVTVHGQIVVCPGVNDGEALEQTLFDILDRYSQLATVALVPLGVSAHNREAEMRSHTSEEARAVLDVVEQWQGVFRRSLGRRVVFAADEYYLMADREFPALDEYEAVAQHENGVGMARTFEREVDTALESSNQAADAGRGVGVRSGFFAWVDGAPADGYRAPRSSSESPVRLMLRSKRNGDAARVGIITGAYGARVLEPLLPKLASATEVDVRLVPVVNEFFGGNIAVTGLLTGTDIAKVLVNEPEEDRYLLPDVVLQRDRFLDELTVADLPRSVEVIGTDGVSLVDALRGTRR